jgi:NAD dependent epimerase/dehydratase
MSQKSILVTGAGGFIGSHLCEQAVRGGYRVRAMVRYSSELNRGWLVDLPPEVLSEIEVFQGDIRDLESVQKAANGVDAILNLAALITIPYSYEAPQSYVETNIGGALNVARVARARPEIIVVQTSTSEVYGTAQFVPITEAHPLHAQSPYAASKIGADQLMIASALSYSFRAVVLRPFNTYGPRQSVRAVIPTTISQILSGKKTIDLGSLHPTRDLTYVEDTARGFLCALAAIDQISGKTIQLGTNHEISIGDLVQTLARLMGTEIQVRQDPSRLRPQASEVERLLSDPSQARELLGWQPKLAGREGLEQGLLKTIAWMKERVR